jgi:hypothetical protein
MREILMSKIILLLILLSTSSFLYAQGYNRIPQDIDFNERLADLLAMPSSNHQTQQVSVLFQIWSRQDPQQAYIALHTYDLPDVFPEDIMESSVISNWIKIDPPSAMQAALESNYSETLDLAFRDYAHQNGDAAYAFAKSNPDRLTLDTWQGIIEGIASHNPTKAASYVLDYGQGGEELIDSFIFNMSERDPAGAIDWLLDHYPDESDYFDPLVARFLVFNPDGARRYLSELPESSYKQELLLSLDRAEKIARGEMP